MAQIPSLKILDLCNITPSESPSSISELSLPTTFLDTFFFQHFPNERLFFFSLSPSHPPFLNSILPKLKLSLSLTLSHFLPLAGNLTWPATSPEPIILYKPGDAVSLTVAETDADFYRLSGNEPRRAIESRCLLPELMKPNNVVAPTMAVQVTVFQGNGFSVGITSDHATHDGKSSTLFLKAWAFICKSGSLPKELNPVFDRTVIKDSALEKLYQGYLQRLRNSNLNGSVKSLKFKPNNGITMDMVKATFELSSLEIEKLKEKEGKWGNGICLSTFVLAYAYVAGCLVKAEGLEDSKKVCLATCADWRPRSELGIPVNYIGNGGVPIGIFANASDFKHKHGVAIIGKKIKEEIIELEKAAKEKKMVELMGQNITKYMKEGAIEKGLSVLGSPRFGLYEIDFGWGKPEKVEFPSIDGGNLISLTESRDGSGGLQVGVALPNDTMDLFTSLFFEGFKAV